MKPRTLKNAFVLMIGMFSLLWLVGCDKTHEPFSVHYYLDVSFFNEKGENLTLGLTEVSMDSVLNDPSGVAVWADIISSSTHTTSFFVPKYPSGSSEQERGFLPLYTRSNSEDIREIRWYIISPRIFGDTDRHRLVTKWKKKKSLSMVCTGVEFDGREESVSPGGIAYKSTIILSGN